MAGDADEVADPQNLKMWLKVNGETLQDGTTATMVYGQVPARRLSQFMSPNLGDVISTGTPPGVGMGMKPPTYLKPGDVIELGIEGPGEQRHVCMDDPARRRWFRRWFRRWSRSSTPTSTSCTPTANATAGWPGRRR